MEWSAASKHKKKVLAYVKKREDGWNGRFTASGVDEGGGGGGGGVRLPEYNALLDGNMRHFFESPQMQRHLLKTGQIDRQGRVVDGSRAHAKLRIIDREFAFAERVDWWRKKAEGDLRTRVRVRREQMLYDQLRSARAARLKEDRQIRSEIIRATLHAQGNGV